ncbi:hypothetical protein B0T17DRAFT_535299 [Bombardia bombarda]|uniref:Uncharacterized protein n=1 Tax=Bombardia bombarda TaxID=252184 RepID=A0AA40C1V0_9PEZI|nr:hypothetical protein B0T17DRAFT_535299 [Bombardia bombarda]
MLGGAQAQERALQPYLNYYTEQCRIACQSSSKLLVRTHQDVLDIATSIRRHDDRSGIAGRLLARNPGLELLPEKEEILETSIDLVVRLMIMIDVGEFKKAFSGRNRLIWVQCTLREFVHNLFQPQSNGGQSRERGKQAGRAVQRTESGQNRRVHGRADYQLGRPSSIQGPGQDGVGLPPRSISQLPARTAGGVRLLERAACNSQGGIRRSAPDDAWLAQWWNDRRDGIQWYTLWVAIGFTVFFGLVQSIEGGMQVYKAWGMGS